jgi:Ca-activated chloride channel homolog
MGFDNPIALVLVLVVPLLLWLYRSRVNSGQASGFAVFSNLEALRGLSKGRGRRNWGIGLYAAAIALAVFALARPQAVIPAPDNLAAVMLSIDISRSMRAIDIEPDRFTAAKEAAKRFVRNLPDGAKVGLVSFAGYATLEVEPTDNHQRVLDQIDLFEMARGTAIGEGLLESLKALPTNEEGKVLSASTVVLLSDGRSNRGIDPLEAVKEAKKMGVVVHTIGLGRKLDSGTPGTPGSPDTSFGNFNNFMAFDEETLRTIADSTGGQYYAAESAKALDEAYRRLNRVVAWKPTRTEVSSLAALGAGLLLFSSLLLTTLNRRVF